MNKIIKKATEPIYGFEFSYTEYEFTDQEREQICSILKKFDSEKIEEFISHLAFICHQAIVLKEGSTVQEIKAYAKPMLNNFKKTQSHLKQLKKGYLSKKDGILLYLYDRIGGKDSFIPQDGCGNKIAVINIWNKAETLEENLSELIHILEGQLQEFTGSGGRPKAGSDDLCFSIGKIFNECLNEFPTTYWNGPFVGIVKKTLEIVGLPNEDPSRMVIDAIRRLKKQ